jgi:drug/metabolite transporter (DMT)-like permease
LSLAGPGARTALDGRRLALVAIGVVAISLSGPVMAGIAMPALVMSFWRNAMAAGLLTPVALTRQRDELAALDLRTAAAIVGAGALLAVHFGTWVSSLKLTSVASSTALVCLVVVWVAAWDRLRGRRLPAAAVAGIVVALVGAFVVTGVDLTVSRRALLGDVLALTGGIAISAYTVVGARVRRTTTTTTYTFGCYGTAAALLGVATVVAGQPLGGYAGRDWALLVLVVLTAHLLGHSVFNHLLATTPPVVVALAMLLEIPGAAILAAVLLGQVPAATSVVGLVLVLGGMAVVVRARAHAAATVAG